MTPLIPEVMPPSSAQMLGAELRARKVPEDIVRVLLVLVSGASPMPSPEWVLAQLSAPSARHVREAYKAGERDYGRLAFLVARHVFQAPAEMAWGAVLPVAEAFPGSVDPSFLDEANGHVRLVFGAMQEAEMSDGDRWVPLLLGLVGVGALLTLPVIFAPGKNSPFSPR